MRKKTYIFQISEISEISEISSEKNIDNKVKSIYNQIARVLNGVQKIWCNLTKYQRQDNNNHRR